jgi:uncharacterized protein (TIGR02145 family)
MKNLFLVFAIFCMLKTNAQNYLISFAGTGASTTVSTVKVENLTKSTSLILNGSDILRLTVTTGVNSFENKQSAGITIFPNPSSGSSVLQIYPPEKGSAIITLFDITGRPLTQIQSYLENCKQDFQLSGINNGLYFISVKGDTYQFSGKLLCNGNSNGTITIKKINANTSEAENKKTKTDYKGTQATVDMAYTDGDRLKFTAISGNYGTVKTDIPAGDKTISFNFIACTDFENNYYPVVEIGTQVWMAENLKTTRLNDGTTIPLVNDNTTWYNMTTPGYCWYSNNEATYKNPYGALYNWHVVNTGKLCPTGWHVPTDPEWAILTTFIGGNAGKLKEKGTIHWQSPNSGVLQLCLADTATQSTTWVHSVKLVTGVTGGQLLKTVQLMHGTIGWATITRIYIVNMTIRLSALV